MWWRASTAAQTASQVEKRLMTGKKEANQGCFAWRSDGRFEGNTGKN